MAIVTLIEAKPRTGALGTQVDVRLAGGGSYVAYVGYRGFLDWKGGVASRPRFSAAIGFGPEGWTGGSIPTSATIQVGASTLERLTYLAGLFWTGAPIEIRVGDDEPGPPTWTLKLKGIVAAASVSGAFLQLTIADLSRDVDRPVCPNVFGGGGGIDGIAEAAGRIKRRSWGLVWNVEGRVLDKANCIYEFGDPAFPFLSLVAIKDKGRAGSFTTLAWQGSIAATFAALQTATVAPGGAVVAPSIACAKWWTTPAGPLTADLRADVSGPGYRGAPGELVDKVLRQFSGLFVDNYAAAQAFRPVESGIHVDDASTTAAAVVDKLLLGASLFWTLDPSGTVTIREFTWSGTPAATLRSETITREAVYSPTRNRKVGYQKNNRQHGDAEISAALLLAGVDTDATRNDDGANMIPAPADPSTWVFLSGAALAHLGTGRPAAENSAQFNVGTNPATRWTNQLLPVRPGETLYFTHAATSDSATAGTNVRGGLELFKSDGSAASTPAIDIPDSAISAAEATGVWVTRYGKVQIPADVAFARPYTVRPGSGPNTIYAAEAVLSRNQPGADVTVDNTPRISTPADVTVQADAGGNIFPGQYNIVIPFQRFRGAVDVTATTTWTITGSSGDVAASFTAPGELTITGGAGRLDLKSSRTNEPDIARSFYVYKNIAPNLPSGGAGSASASTTSIGSVTSATYGTVHAGPLTLAANASGAINVSASLQFARNGTRFLYAKAQIRPSGSGSFADIVAETTGYPGTASGPGEPAEPGGVGLSATASGLTAGGNYDVRLLLRLDSGSTTIAPYGTFSASQ